MTCICICAYVSVVLQYKIYYIVVGMMGVCVRRVVATICATLQRRSNIVMASGGVARVYMCIFK